MQYSLPTSSEAYRASTIRMPSSTSNMMRSLTWLTRSVRNVLSIVMICDTFITESWGSSVSSVLTGTLPGAAASRRFVVNTTAIMVWIRLRLKSSDWRMSTGLRYPGSEVMGSDSSAHQTSPRRTISHLSATTAPASGQGPDQGGLPLYCRSRQAAR